ncbi:MULTISPECIES: DUF881 domain-containing protein [unclassified Frankia]
MGTTVHGGLRPWPWPGSRSRRVIWAVSLFWAGVLSGVVVLDGGPFDRAGPRDTAAWAAQERAGVAQVIDEEAGRVADRRAGLDAESRRRATTAQAVPSGAPGSARGTDAAARSLVERLAGPAGLAPVRGPALTVELDDVPREGRGGPYAPGVPAPRPDDLIVHQQDVQAVVNALWAGGAEAMSIMDRRVTALTAVRCVGNTLLLHGEVFSPPFRITAIGEVAALRSSLRANPQVTIYRQYADAYRLGYRVEEAADSRLSGYDGPMIDLSGTARRG